MVSPLFYYPLALCVLVWLFVLLRRLQSPCSSLGLENVQVPNRVRNDLLPRALSWSSVPQSGHVAWVSRKVVTCGWSMCCWRVPGRCEDSARDNPRCSMCWWFLVSVMTLVTVSW